ncbi:MAG: Rossmann-like domain-containing protein [Syntrophobacteraceae bacterium]
MANDVYRTLKEKIRELAESNKWLHETVRVKARVLSTEEAIGNPEEDDFPLQKGKERLMQATFHSAHGQAFTDSFGDFEGTLEEVLAGRLENNYRRAVFVATLNAVVRKLDLTYGTIHCRDKEPAQCASELAAYLQKRYNDNRIVQIGFQPRMIEALSQKFPLRVVDLDADNIGSKAFGITIEGPQANEDALEWADVLLVTGSTLVNGTIESFLVGKPVIFYGTTVAGAASLMGWERFCACGH